MEAQSSMPPTKPAHHGARSTIWTIVVAVGVLHTIVPDHWVPITLIARAQGWSARETALAALKAGTGHVVSTLLIGAIVWIAGAAFATRFGNAVSIAATPKNSAATATAQKPSKANGKSGFIARSC